MPTPTRQQIEQYARELYIQQCYRDGTPELADINPELNELREAGWLSLAQSELMTDTATRHTEQYEDYIQQCENLEKKPFAFDVETALTQGTTICGGRGCGKSTLAKQIVKQLQEHSVKVLAFDNSQAWLNSSIETVIRVTPNSQVESSLDSAIYDLSMLTPAGQRRFIESQVQADYYQSVATAAKQRTSTVFIFEEAEIILGKTCNTTTLQLLSVGRNYRLSYLAVVQRLARLNTDAISLSGQLYVGKLHEINDLRKIKNWVSDTEQLKSLELGDFIRYSEGKTELVHVQPFETTTEHTFITAAPLETVTAPQPRNVDYAPLAKVALIIALGLLFLLGAVA
jgi:energy-coupling factor transporter ATP-binding protein EcfA2